MRFTDHGQLVTRGARAIAARRTRNDLPAALSVRPVFPRSTCSSKARSRQFTIWPTSLPIGGLRSYLPSLAGIVSARLRMQSYEALLAAAGTADCPAAGILRVPFDPACLRYTETRLSVRHRRAPARVRERTDARHARAAKYGVLLESVARGVGHRIESR